MEEVYKYYRDTASRNAVLSSGLSRRIHVNGTMRLMIVLAAALTIILWPQPGWIAVCLILFAYAVLFFRLVMRHNRLVGERAHADALIKLCEDELAALDYDFSAFDGAPEKASGDHPFSLDLDLFGRDSMFASLNRTVTREGRETLSFIFQNPLSDKTEIENRQRAIAELSPQIAMRQDFYVAGVLRRGRDTDTKLVEYLSGLPLNFSGKPFWKAVIWVVPALWVALITLCALGYISLLLPLIFFCVCIAMGAIKMKQINKLHESVGHMDRVFSSYAELLAILENAGFESPVLRRLQQRIATDGRKASAAIRELSKYLHKMDQRGSVVVVLINIFVFRDIRVSMRVERWMQRYGDQIAEWFGALGEFDALSSLAGFAFNHPDYIYPKIADHYFQMEGSGLGHPLMHRDVCVKNDISIAKAPQFMIVTGANMAGKSTYLRTIGVNFLLSGIGAPVCADSLTLYPASLVTSLRTSDSLAANESYFYAELKRLKTIIDRLEAGEKLFIILDEILKGTNSDDKQKGSLALVRQFVSYGACGIIATHDLVLGTLRDELPEYIGNFRFESEIEDDRLSFPYRMQEGVAQNLNACFLMKKMGITI